VFSVTSVRFATLAALALVGVLVVGLSDDAGYGASGKPEPGRTSDARFSVRVESRSRATVTLRWTPVRGVRGYAFFRDGKFLSRTPDPRRASATFSLPREGRHLFEVQVLGKPLSAGVFVGRNGAGCFSSPGACGYPDPTYGNVGVPAGTALTLNNGDLTVTTNGAVINAMHVNGYILVQADNVTIENTLVTNTGTPGGFAIEEPNGYHGLTVKNSEISGNNIYMGGCDGCPNGTVDHVYMHNCGECVQYANAVTNSYFMVDASSSVYHYEAYFGSDSTVDFEHDTILNPHEQTADIFVAIGTAGGACDNQVTINNSLLAGGGYEFYPCAVAGSAGTSKVTITNNRFARCTTTPTVNAGSGYICQGIGDPTGNGDAITNPDKNGYFPHGGFFGTDAYIYCSQTTWTNNVWDDNGAARGC
jgi:hypothetical protein